MSGRAGTPWATLWDTLLHGTPRVGLPLRAWAALFTIALCAMLPGFFNLPPTDRDEARYAQAARQMMETGDIIDIRFQDQPRHVKPIGIYWLQLITTAPFGGENAPIWAHRLPSLFGAFIAIAVIAAFGARLFSPQVGLAAGIILALCLLVGVNARMTSTDAMLMASAAIAQTALFFVVRRPPPVTPTASYDRWLAIPGLVLLAAIAAAFMVIVPKINAAQTAAEYAFSADEAKTLTIIILVMAIALIPMTAITGAIIASKRFPGPAIIFWVASGAALMIKGPFVAMVSATTLIGYGLWTRDWRWVKTLRILPGLTIVFAIAAPWLIAITAETGAGFFAESLGHSLGGKVTQGDDSHGAPPGYHTIALLFTFWPSTLLLPLAAAHVWLNRHKDDIRFLVMWIIPTWIIFELVATKLMHYTLPVFPGLALLAALGMTAAPDLLVKKTKAFTITYRCIAGVALLASALIGFAGIIAQTTELNAPITGQTMAPTIAMAITGLIATAAMGYFALKPSNARLLILAASAVAFYLGFAQTAAPSIDQLWPSHRLHKAIAAADLPNCEHPHIASAFYREPSLVFHFGTNTNLTDIPGMARHLVDNPTCGIALVDARNRTAFDDALASLGHTATPVLSAPYRGVNVSQGDELEIHALMLHQPSAHDQTD